MAYHQDVKKSKDKDKNTRRNHNAPESQTKRFLTGCLFVEVSEDVDAQYDHTQSQENEAVFLAKQRPVAREVSPEDWQLGDDQEHAGECGDDIAAPIEEEELVDRLG
jgi:hypothetical protein